MIDITHKITSIRIAAAQAVVKVSSKATIDAIINKNVPKGDVLEMAKTAGLFGVKQTALMIPDCHPIPIEYTGVEYDINGLEITILMTVKTIYRTGVEVEAMHGASVVALTMYDMLKPIDKGVEIHTIKLLNKSGGKSDFKNIAPKGLKVSSIVCSTPIFNQKKDNNLSPIIAEKLSAYGVNINEQHLINSDKETLNNLLELLYNHSEDMIIITGGTGLSKDDNSVEIVKNLIDYEIPGMSELVRNYGQERTPKAFISRSIIGVKNKSLVLLLPGSVNGLKDAMECLIPYVFYAFKSLKK